MILIPYFVAPVFFSKKYILIKKISQKTLRFESFLIIVLLKSFDRKCNKKSSINKYAMAYPYKIYLQLKKFECKVYLDRCQSKYNLASQNKVITKVHLSQFSVLFLHRVTAPVVCSLCKIS